MITFRGYKSESASILSALPVTAPLFFMPTSLYPLYIPAAITCMRLLARGSRNHMRPPRESSPENRDGFSFVMSKGMIQEKRPVAIVTGTNSGIGYYTAVDLAAEGYVVVSTCRSAELARTTAEQIKAAAEAKRQGNPSHYKDAPTPVLVDGSFPLECDNLDNIRSFVAQFLKVYGACNLQVLVNNAGMMRKDLQFSKFNPKAEQHMAVNFLGPLLLTELLLPQLEKNDGRVVYVGSEAHRYASYVLSEDGVAGQFVKGSRYLGKLLKALMELCQGADQCSGILAKDSTRDGMGRYAVSKLLNTYHAHDIARRYANAPAGAGKKVYACSLHPGFVATNFQQDLIRTQWVNRLYQQAALILLKSSEEGAQTSLHCAMCPPKQLEVVPAKGADALSAKAAVSPYFVECRNQTHGLLRPHGWDVEEMEAVVQWGKKMVGLQK